jgi:ketosteroid isomerase-like protein
MGNATVEQTAVRKSATDGAAETWIEAFVEGWRAPAGPDAFADHFLPWLDPEIRLVQPQLPVLVGHRAFREGFARPLFALIPDLHGEVESWAASGDVIYIEVVLRGTLGGGPVEFRSCDRITLRDGLAIERVAYMDPGAILAAVARRPRAWPAFVRSQARRLLGGGKR